MFVILCPYGLCVYSWVCIFFLSSIFILFFFFFFFQAEDGIRDRTVTGVQTCALPISDESRYEKETMTPNVVIAPAQRYVVEARYPKAGDYYITNSVVALDHIKIGRASCRERV